MRKVLFLSLLVFILDQAHDNQPNQPNNSIIYAPWRDSYLGEKKESRPHLLPGQCVFCSYPEQDNDKQHLIVERHK